VGLSAGRLVIDEAPGRINTAQIDQIYRHHGEAPATPLMTKETL